MHDKRVWRVGGFFHFLLRLPLSRRRCALRRPGVDPAALLFNPGLAYRAGGGDRATSADHARPRPARPLRAASADRALGVANLDVRVGDRRHGLPDGLPALPASAARYGGPTASTRGYRAALRACGT